MLESLVDTLARAREFASSNFKLTADMEEGAVISPPRKANIVDLSMCP